MAKGKRNIKILILKNLQPRSGTLLPVAMIQLCQKSTEELGVILASGSTELFCSVCFESFRLIFLISILPLGLKHQIFLSGLCLENATKC